ncbi:MAG: hypothetical protein RLZ33_75 [Bacteroidota bacterium]|jgi:hypothetical protein
MYRRVIDIDFNTEPFKKLVHPLFVEESKQILRFMAYKTLNKEVGADGSIEFTEEEFMLYLKHVEGVTDFENPQKFQSVWDEINE